MAALFDEAALALTVSIYSFLHPMVRLPHFLLPNSLMTLFLDTVWFILELSEKAFSSGLASSGEVAFFGKAASIWLIILLNGGSLFSESTLFTDAPLFYNVASYKGAPF